MSFRSMAVRWCIAALTILHAGETSSSPGADKVIDAQAYDKIVAEAQSDDGVFTVHRVADQIFYEIPERELGRDFLWVSRIAKVPLGVDDGYGGRLSGTRVVRWERHGNRLLLRETIHGITADPTLPVADAVETANFSPIIMSFSIEAIGKKNAPVANVTRLFVTEVPEFSVRSKVGRAQDMDPERSFVESVKSFPENVEVEAVNTYSVPPDPSVAASAAPPRMPPISGSVLMHHSMVKLPETPMKPRLFDDRVGFDSVGTIDYGSEDYRITRRKFITRFRLDKKNPGSALSDPVKPIVYWIDRATPRKWVPYVKQGVEEWRQALEAAGFTNAIFAEEAPTAEENPDWSANDARYSMIRWAPTLGGDILGLHVNDPRTGETISADIQIHQHVLGWLQNMYFVQAAPLDPSARKLPLSDEVVGSLLRYIVAHEVGHSLGLEHNMKASALYPAAKVRDPKWVAAMGHVASVMDYSRMNYVAQPEDGIAVEDLIPRVGPYDRWAVRWGYAEIPDFLTPDDERATLDTWAREQDQVPWYRFSNVSSFGEVEEQSEAVGDADAVESTRLGLKNLERVAGYLLPAVEGRVGESYDELKGLYDAMMGQWKVEMGHVVNIVGGFHSQQKHIGQEGVRFTPVARERQAEAVAFLNEHAFMVPGFAIRPQILRRIGPDDALARIRSHQRDVLRMLLDASRLNRMMEQEAMDGGQAYQLTDFLNDVRRGVWKELAEPRVHIDPYRRNLQRTYLELLCERMSSSEVVDDSRALLRGELVTLDVQIVKALPKAADTRTHLHLLDMRVQISQATHQHHERTRPPISN
ncbi:zinc-dependent metalloprotease [Pseudoxanthomonas yeongjuensis]|uniref:zinc-dependent metalloprotease n=1 Tax=Pseudoxanthomonas yeongjuensis TaxID=377616 RepID=UPI001390C7B8|nr:zinc-dependent metalloprotease [Pseudoxanthomonas yeongjuensis]KAF1716833.1 zinc-dependent metalloprotease [Pseudoxanthomonas yeongjuensis]